MRIQRRRGRPLFILRYGSLGQRNIARSGAVKSNARNEMELPSWVPEWNVKTNKTYQVNTSYEACGKFRIADLVPTSSLNILGVRGFCVDTIVALGEMPRIDRLHFPDGPRKIMGFFDSVQRLINISKKNERAKAIYGTTSHHDAALWRAPIGDQYIAFGVGRIPSKRADSKLESVYREFVSYYEDFASREGNWLDFMAAYDA